MSWGAVAHCYADRRELCSAPHALKKIAANLRDGANCWQPALLLTTLAARGQSFAERK